MLSLKADKRKLIGKKSKKLKEQGLIPAVLYGPEIKNLSLELDLKEFNKVYKQAGASSLISLEVEEEKFSVLIHEVKKDPLKGEAIHVDFYQPILTEEVEATVPILFEGEAPAVKDLAGTLIKEIQEVEVRALPQDLPHEIKVNVEELKTFEDEILIKDLKVSDKVKIQKDPDEVVANVVPPETEKIEEELEKPAEPVSAEAPAGEEAEAEEKDQQDIKEEKKNEEK